MDGLLRKGKIKNYDNIMTGLYAGNVVSKSIDFSEIDWSGRMVTDKTKQYSEKQMFSPTKKG